MNCFKCLFRIHSLAIVILSLGLWSMQASAGDLTRDMANKTPKVDNKRKLSAGKENSTPGSVNKKPKFDDDSGEGDESPKSPLSYTPRTFKISPIKYKKYDGIGAVIRHYSVYVMVAINGDDISYIPSHDDRIGFSSILGEEVKIHKKNLEKALLII